MQSFLWGKFYPRSLNTLANTCKFCAMIGVCFNCRSTSGINALNIELPFWPVHTLLCDTKPSWCGTSSMCTVSWKPPPPKPFILEPNQVRLKPNPVRQKPKPVILEPSPVGQKPIPVCLEPNPVRLKPNPVRRKRSQNLEPNPVRLKPTYLHDPWPPVAVEFPEVPLHLSQGLPPLDLRLGMD